MFKNIVNNRWKQVEKKSGIYIPTINPTRFINKDSKVCLMGSCFADQIGWVLKESKINIGDVIVNDKMKSVQYPWGTFFSPLNLYNILKLTMDRNIDKVLDEKSFFKVHKSFTGNNFEKKEIESSNYKLINYFIKGRTETADIKYAREKIKKNFTIFYNSILQADVVIITLGLIETWVDRKKKIAWHSFQGNPIKKKSLNDLAEFHILDIYETTDIIKKIIKIINSISKKKIIFTVSPIPMNYTFTDKDVVVANKYSKSVLRASIEKFIDNKNIFYFPSFEIVLDCIGWPAAFQKDKRHIELKYFNKYIKPLFLNSFFKS